MKHNTLRSLALAAALGIGMLDSVTAAPYTTLDAENSRVSFAYSQMNVGMDGAFGQIVAKEFSFDPAQPQNAKVAIEIPLASIDAGYDEANVELEKDEWLSLAAHPLATFNSTKVEALGDDRYQVSGELSIKGLAKEIAAPFTFTEENGVAAFEGEFSFQRADFAIGEGQWRDFSIVANDIKIKFRVIAKQ